MIAHDDADEVVALIEEYREEEVVPERTLEDIEVAERGKKAEEGEEGEDASEKQENKK